MWGGMQYRRQSGAVSGARADTADAGPPAPRLLDQVRDACRVRHYSVRTERAYSGWIRRFILANGKRHPREMGAIEVEDS